MWHAAWQKTHSHLWQRVPPLYYKDTFSERISSFHKKRREREQGSATRAEKLKANEQVSPLQLLKGMTTSTQRQPRVCLRSINLFNPKSVAQGETTLRAILRAPLGAIIDTCRAEHCILRQEIMFCYAEECIISKNSCESQSKQCQMISDRFL